MKRRSRAGGKSVKALPRKALKLKGRKASKAVTRRSSAVADTEVVRLTRERDEALEQQGALSEVLRVISQSDFELQYILQDVAKTAARLCRSDGAAIFQLENGGCRFAAGYSLSPAYVEIERQSLITPGPGTVIGRAAMTRKVVRIDDVFTDPLYEKKEDAKIEGNRSFIGVPLIRDGEPIVVIGLGRRRVDPFGEREIELATTFAAQAVIAIENAGCSTNCVSAPPISRSRWSNRPRPRRCFRSSAVLLAMCSPCSPPCWRRLSVFAMPPSETFTAGTATPYTSRRRTTRRLSPRGSIRSI
jgi:hypothetical protein